MSLKDTEKSKELYSKYCEYKNFKKEYEETIPAQLEAKKLQLITIIQDIQSCACYDVETTAEEKAEFDNLLATLTD